MGVVFGVSNTVLHECRLVEKGLLTICTLVSVTDLAMFSETMLVESILPEYCLVTNGANEGTWFGSWFGVGSCDGKRWRVVGVSGNTEAQGTLLYF